jgi:hypothetical protein
MKIRECKKEGEKERGEGERVKKRKKEGERGRNKERW